MNVAMFVVVFRFMFFLRLLFKKCKDGKVSCSGVTMAFCVCDIYSACSVDVSFEAELCSVTFFYV